MATAWGQTETPLQEEWGFVFLQIYPPADTKNEGDTWTGEDFKSSQRLSIFLVRASLSLRGVRRRLHAREGVVVSSDAQHADSLVPFFLCRFLHCGDVPSGMFSGDYDASSSCITSPNYSENFPPDGSLRHQTCVSLDVVCENFGLRWCGTRWWWTAKTAVDRLVLWVLRQTVRSLVFQMELVAPTDHVFKTLIEPAMYVGIQLSCLFTLRDRRWGSWWILVTMCHIQ